ncbi:MAG: hypothetical protein HW383_562 [Candidatus Magasanikbacteria bacterium]|nr:hypothetical protein [Candidatus Magasanikbacteria bacterium]
MFDKKPHTVIDQPEQPAGEPITVHTIPPDFYGGRSPLEPVIETGPAKAAPSRAVVGAAPSIPGQVTKIAPSKPAAGAAFFASHKKLILIGGIAFLVVFMGGASWYVIVSSRPPTPPPLPRPAGAPAPVAEVPSAPTEEVPPPEAPPPVKPAPTPLILPTTLPSTPDFDRDNLTDAEEALLGTDVAKPDTDDDTYDDAVELANLYNPRAEAPQKLKDSGLVRQYVNPTFRYAVYYPESWLARPLDETTNDEIMFTAVSGEYVEARAIPLAAGQTFAQWFVFQFPNVPLSSLQTFTNRLGQDGLKTADGLAAFFPGQNFIYVLVYNVGTRTDINFKALFNMMVQSFESAPKPENIPLPVASPAPLPETTIVSESESVTTPETVVAPETTPTAPTPTTLPGPDEQPIPETVAPSP